MRIAWVVLLLAACANTHWAWRNAKGTESFKVDWYECTRDARSAGLALREHLFSTRVKAVADVDEDFRDMCMEARDWELVEVSNKPHPNTVPAPLAVPPEMDPELQRKVQ